METRKVKSTYKGREVISTFSFSTSPPWKLEIETPEIFHKIVEADDLFQALKEARVTAESIDLFFLCNGARKDVYPSPMARNMGGGIVAYELTLGKQALRKDLVKIFDNTDKAVCSPREQEEHYQQWLSSL
jgi:hypothetical protein